MLLVPQLFRMKNKAVVQDNQSLLLETDAD